jgi:glutamate 5-kinase
MHEATAKKRRHDVLRAARRVVIKLGTNTVTGREGDLCRERIEPLVCSVAGLVKAGRQVVLVSSGAVGLGRAWLGLHRSRLNDLATKQACAAVGQSLLMDAYRELFSAVGLKVAQVLLTEEDFTVWRRYSNLKQTIDRLLQFGVIPIINENDTVSTAELAATRGDAKRPVFSDNDRLAALVMSGLGADALVLLTNVDGLLRPQGDKAARGDAAATVISLVERITPELQSLAAGPSANGRGGMLTKLEAAEIAMHCGGAAVIANGQLTDVLDRIFAGEPLGTVFLPLPRMRGKRRWIAYAADVQGRIVVDEGAREVLLHGKASLLTSGVVRIESRFAPKDVVSIVDGDGREFARGIAACASHEAEALLGKRPGSARTRPPAGIVVRRDNIVLL